jgi:hypothetical protein
LLCQVAFQIDERGLLLVVNAMKSMARGWTGNSGCLLGDVSSRAGGCLLQDDMNIVDPKKMRKNL